MVFVFISIPFQAILWKNVAGLRPNEFHRPLMGRVYSLKKTNSALVHSPHSRATFVHVDLPV